MRSTPDVVETRDDVLSASLATALEGARDTYGHESDGGWVWSRVATANVDHVLSFSPFSARDLPIRGGPETLSPNAGNGGNGASWRMVVELGEEVEGRGIYPGGQSGHPLSSAYKQQIEDWVGGRLRPLRFPRTVEEMANISRSRATLLPESHQ